MRKKNKHKISLNVKNINKKTGIKNKDLEYEKDLNKSINIANQFINENKKDRESRIGKTSLELMNELKYKEENDEKRLFIKERLVAILVVIIIFVLIYLFFKYADIFGISINSNSKKVYSVDIVTSNDDLYYNYVEDLLVYSNQDLATYDKNGNKNWEYKIGQSFVPKIYIKDKYLAVSNNANGYVYLFYNKKEILDKKIEGNIKNIYLDIYGNMAIEYTTNGYKKIIGIYDKKGKLLSELYLNSDAITDIEILNNASRLIVTKVTSSSYSIGTQIVSYNLKEENPTEEEIAELNDLYSFKTILKKSNIVLLTDGKIISINVNTNEQKIINEFNSSQVIFTDISKDYYVKIEKLLNSSDNLYQIATNSYTGEGISATNLDDSPMMLKSKGYINYLIYQNSIKVFNKWGVNIRNFSISMYPKDVIAFNEGKSIALVYTNRIDIFNI